MSSQQITPAPAIDPPALDPAKLQAFMGQVVSDFGAGISAALVVIGDQLGLYKSLAQDGPLSSSELAERTGTTERYIREWLVTLRTR